MKLLERFGKSIRRLIPILQRNINDSGRAVLKLESRERQASSADIFRERNPGQEAEHPLEVIIRAQRKPGRLFEVNVLRQPILDISHRLIHAFQHIHSFPSFPCFQNSR
ncbi:hypothetical protein D3C73_1277160 [compost metagenome]